MTAVGIVGLAVWNGMRLGEVVYPGTSATVSCLIGVVLVLSQTGERGHVSNWLTWQPLVALGQVSYGVYVWQQLFLGPPAPVSRTSGPFRLAYWRRSLWLLLPTGIWKNRFSN